MGYTKFRRLTIRKFKDKRKNPVVQITIPYDIIKKMNWEDKDIIMFSPYESGVSQDLTLINLNRCPETQFGGKILNQIGEMDRQQLARTKAFNDFKPKRRKKLIGDLEILGKSISSS